MDIQKEKEAFEKECKLLCYKGNMVMSNLGSFYNNEQTNWMWQMWLSSKAQAVPAQLDVNSILHDIDCYFDNGLSNTERTANNLLQSIYEKLSGEVKAQEPAK